MLVEFYRLIRARHAADVEKDVAAAAAASVAAAAVVFQEMIAECCWMALPTSVHSSASYFVLMV